MNTTPAEGVALASELAKRAAEIPSDVKLIVAPPFTHLTSVQAAIAGTKIELSSQNCALQPKGAYTGEVSAAMVAGTGAAWVILGHSERREYFCEDNAMLLEKIHQAFACGLKVIYCMGESLEQRESGVLWDFLKSQITEVLYNLDSLKDVVVAYEPIWAIGTGKTASNEQAQEVHAFIRKTVAEKFGAEAADELTILYGGSCKPSNAKELFACPDIDGGLIGGASLKADDFLAIAKSY